MSTPFSHRRWEKVPEERMRALRSKVLLFNLTQISFTPRKILRRARTLRRTETEAEKRLRGYLRDRRLNGNKFIRQAPVGPYFADFLCREKRLIVEVDGATHSEDREIAYDVRRTEFLTLQGYRVHRVQNVDVFTILPDVLDMILMKLEELWGVTAP